LWEKRLEGLEEELAVEEEGGDGVDGRLVTLARGLLKEDVEGVEGGRGKEELFEGAEEEVHGGWQRRRQSARTRERDERLEGRGLKTVLAGLFGRCLGVVWPLLSCLANGKDAMSRLGGSLGRAKSRERSAVGPVDTLRAEEGGSWWASLRTLVGFVVV